jgi:hypothetical protein
MGSGADFAGRQLLVTAMTNKGPPVFLGYDQAALDPAYDQAAYDDIKTGTIEIRHRELVQRDRSK